ncbi:MAG: GNAT family N-acetyltransferase [Negativicutes bacterium]|jgi:hypothetical protein
MIRKLSDADNDVVMPFLLREPAKNLFIIGDIYNNGYSREFQECWGDFMPDGTLRAMLLFYHQHFMIAANGEHDRQGFAEIIRSYPQFINIAGTSENVADYRPLLDLTTPRKFCFAQMDVLTEFGKNDVKVECATAADAQAVAALLATITEFAQPAGAERIASAIIRGESRYYIVREAGQVVANAATVAENPHSAMIVAVACAKNHRGRGYATACMRMLCEALLSEGKKLCLFFDNPAAGNIYRKLGFYDIGDWMALNRKKAT